MKKIIVGIIKTYQKISSLIPGKCRFYPTCSNYSILAVEKFGTAKGIWLSLRRVVKCHPFNRGGYDPIP